MDGVVPNEPVIGSDNGRCSLLVTVVEDLQPSKNSQSLLQSGYARMMWDGVLTLNISWLLLPLETGRSLRPCHHCCSALFCQIVSSSAGHRCNHRIQTGSWLCARLAPLVEAIAWPWLLLSLMCAG
jgi:hypothetical protein